ncbi:Fibrinogen-like protein A [Holothuria leucospilota]|uniref:Fibrinogen-like protein A n=1 Tax=Holothuria leucospilota TaxID=206669 RepID=A0A9Q1BW64_HOLLE|nr:Fibrinogen-like protein A [Holothuria leucospilota]
MSPLIQLCVALVLLLFRTEGIVSSQQSVYYFFYQRPAYPRDCKEALDSCHYQRSSGIYVVKPDGYDRPFEVYCDNKLDSGGWTVILRRHDGSVTFKRDWLDYKSGFGFLSQELWIGHEKLAFLTNQKIYELRIDVTYSDDTSIYALYSLFRISDAFSNYRLSAVGLYPETNILLNISVWSMYRDLQRMVWRDRVISHLDVRKDVFVPTVYFRAISTTDVIPMRCVCNKTICINVPVTQASLLPEIPVSVHPMKCTELVLVRGLVETLKSVHPAVLKVNGVTVLLGFTSKDKTVYDRKTVTVLQTETLYRRDKRILLLDVQKDVFVPTVNFHAMTTTDVIPMQRVYNKTIYINVSATQAILHTEIPVYRSAQLMKCTELVVVKRRVETLKSVLPVVLKVNDVTVPLDYTLMDKTVYDRKTVTVLQTETLYRFVAFQEGHTYIAPGCTKRCFCINGQLSCDLNYRCDPNAVCLQQNNMYRCTCNAGFTPSGDTCICSSNEVYGTCTCERSCENPQVCTPCSTQGQRCHCPIGFYLQGQDCVQQENCNCFTDGNIVPEGATYISAGCSQRCSCVSGQLSCDVYQCSANAVCEERNNILQCYCNAGFTGDGVNCISDTPPSDCQDIYDRVSTESAVYQIKPTTWQGDSFDVYCNMSDGGGWTVFQRRVDGSQDFFLYWSDYKDGFGTADNELWLGNDKLHSLTSQGNYELRIDLLDSLGSPYYAKYSSFSISDVSDNYRLSLGTYSGTAGDSLSYHDGQAFTTRDRDNDRHSSYNCATDYYIYCDGSFYNYNGAWWYKYCARSSLNSPYGTGAFYWYYLPGGNPNNCNIKYSEMKVRRI